jgi:hypothetical protein
MPQQHSVIWSKENLDCCQPWELGKSEGKVYDLQIRVKIINVPAIMQLAFQQVMTLHFAVSEDPFMIQVFVSKFIVYKVGQIPLETNLKKKLF